MSTASKIASDAGEFIRALRLSDRIKDDAVEVYITDLYKYSTDFYKTLYTNPLELLPELLKQLQLLFSREIYLIFSGYMLPGALRTPHEVKALDFASFITLDGVVRRAEMPRPVVRRLCFLDDKNQVQQQNFIDPLTNLQQTGASFFFTSQTQGERLYGLSQFDLTQKIYVQDAPESLRFTMPSSIMCVMGGKLTDQVRPGDRVHIYGVYLPAPHTNIGGVKTTTTRGYMLCFGVEKANSLSREIKHESDIQQLLKTLGGSALTFLAHSFAPSIFGLKTAKKAILLQLLSGTPRAAGSTRIRADINIYLTGAPGCGKSQLLKFAYFLARIATASTGRGTSAAGLTAGVINNAVEAGAMVLADGGICCVDEFDKLLMQDRAAVHEAMEQQTVSIHKAGAHVYLNARCAVLAAGNLAFNEWNDDLSIMENLNMPESLISRFDLIFLVKDTRSHDRDIAAYVFYNRYGNDDLEDDLNIALGAPDEILAKVPLGFFMPFYNTFESEFNDLKARISAQQHLTKQRFLLKQDFLREIIEHCRTKTPLLTDETAKLIATLYAEMRLNSIQKNVIVTARALESLIRLATACAKLNTGKDDGFVTYDNVEEAYLIIRSSLFGETEAQAKRDLRQTKNIDGIKTYISEIFTDYCSLQEEGFPLATFQTHCMSALKDLGIRISEAEFLQQFYQVLSTVSGVFFENGMIYM